MNRIVKYFKKLPWQEKVIVCIGFFLILIIFCANIISSKCLLCVSSDLSIWKDRIELITLIMGPYIAAVAAYYVWKTLDVQSYAKIVDGYGNVYMKLDAEIKILIKQYNYFLSDVLVKENQYEVNYAVNDINNNLLYLLIEYITLNDVVSKRIKYELNRALLVIHITNFNLNFEKFLLAYVGFKENEELLIIQDRNNILREEVKGKIQEWHQQRLSLTSELQQ